jgi:flagellar hook-length control protein FliK
LFNAAPKITLNRNTRAEITVPNTPVDEQNNTAPVDGTRIAYATPVQTNNDNSADTNRNYGNASTAQQADTAKDADNDDTATDNAANIARVNTFAPHITLTPRTAISTPTPTVPVETQIFGEINAKLSDISDNGDYEFEMTLDPERLGKITVKIAAKDGVLSVSLTAQTSETARLIDNRLAGLRDNFNEHGVNVGTLTAELQSDAKQFDSNGRGFNRYFRPDQQTDDDEGSEEFGQLLSALAQ